MNKHLKIGLTPASSALVAAAEKFLKEWDAKCKGTICPNDPDALALDVAEALRAGIPTNQRILGLAEKLNELLRLRSGMK